jgi:manganese transport protein
MNLRSLLPTQATAPFCPSEVKGSIEIAANANYLQKLRLFMGPGLLVAVGYMDPGNWATGIEAGARFGYSLLSVVILSSFVAMLFQYLSVKLGTVTNYDLAANIKKHYSPGTNILLWLFAELSIIACDVAEVLGCALAIQLLFHIPLLAGVGITALDTIFILGLQGRGFRAIESLIFMLILTIAMSFLINVIYAKPDFHTLYSHIIPSMAQLTNQEFWYLAIGIIGATIMPHNLYLHSSIVQTRKIQMTAHDTQDAVRYFSIDTACALSLALLVNCGILILASSTFHYNQHSSVSDIGVAYQLLSPLLGAPLAGILFAVGLLAAGQSSTLTGTIAGQAILEGHLHWKIPCWQRRIITRSLALIPAAVGIMVYGDGGIGKLLVASQVCLGLQLPFALFPLISFTGKKQIMGLQKNTTITQLCAWLLFIIVVLANGVLLYRTY